MLVYLDTCAMVYAVEGQAPSRGAVEGWIRRAQAGGGRVVSSLLARLECRVKPLRDGNAALLAWYETFFANVVLHPINLAVVDLATEIRARHRFKTPDAIHLATAMHAGVDVFVTGDRDLARCADLRVEVV